MITEQDLDTYAAALTRNGFFGPDSWYMNASPTPPTRRRAERRQAAMPVLFLHGAYDVTCETMTSRLGRADAPRLPQLTEVSCLGPLDGAGAARGGERGAGEVAGNQAPRLLAGIDMRVVSIVLVALLALPAAAQTPPARPASPLRRSRRNRRPRTRPLPTLNMVVPQRDRDAAFAYYRDESPPAAARRRW